MASKIFHRNYNDPITARDRDEHQEYQFPNGHADWSGHVHFILSLIEIIKQKASLFACLYDIFPVVWAGFSYGSSPSLGSSISASRVAPRR